MKQAKYLPYIILVFALLLAILFPQFAKDYEILLLLILCPLGAWAIYKTEPKS